MELLPSLSCIRSQELDCDCTFVTYALGTASKLRGSGLQAKPGGTVGCSDWNWTYSTSLYYSQCPFVMQHYSNTQHTSSPDMSRPSYNHSLRMQTTSQYCQPPASEADDLSLFSTILLVIVMLIGAAFFIMTLSYLLANEYDVGAYL